MSDFGGGLFGCFNDCGLCIMAYCCPCVVFGQTASLLEKGSCLVCAIGYSFCNICCLLSAYMRTEAQKAVLGADSADSMLTNCCVTYWCHLCALTQEARAVKKWKTGAPEEVTMERV